MTLNPSNPSIHLSQSKFITLAVKVQETHKKYWTDELRLRKVSRMDDHKDVYSGLKSSEEGLLESVWYREAL